MAFAPAKRLSRRWSSASALLVLLALLPSALWAGSSPGREGKPEVRSVLLFPVGSHWVARPTADRATSALQERIAAAGLTVTLFDPASPVFQGFLPADTPLTAIRDVYAVLAGADASLVATVTETEAELSLAVEVEGAVSRRKVNLQFAAPVGQDKDLAVADLAKQVVAALTPETWAQAGADQEGRKRGAAERYVEGRQATEEGNWEQASVHFEAAIVGDPDVSEYFVAAAEAMLNTWSDGDRALVRIRRAASLAPSDTSLRLLEGDIALLANRPEEAEGAFRAAQAADPNDPKALEGLARAARARNQFERSVSYYQELIARLPELAGQPASLPRLLAGAGDDTVRLTAATPDELPRELGLLYLGGGLGAEGARQLLVYHQHADRPPYRGDQYLTASSGMDAEAEAVARAARAALTERDLGEVSEERAEEKLQALHDRSDNLATVGERMVPPGEWEAAHRYRVLAYNLLNQSNFEALLYAQTGDADRLRRCEFWRKAYREAVSLALELQNAGTPSLAGGGPSG